LLETLDYIQIKRLYDTGAVSGVKNHLYVPQRGCVWRMSGTIVCKEKDFPV
jgi:hypothetical protein